MRRPLAWFALGSAVGTLLAVALLALLWFRNPAPACRFERIPYNPNYPGASGLLSPDQITVLQADGPPQAFTMLWDRQTGAILEEWSYYTLGREITFLDGAYVGGLEVPPPDLDPSATIPSPAMYPWDIRQESSPECVVKLAGPAAFRTSALVLPGWNEDREIARLWTLAAGGSMITVDGRLALLSIDPGEAIDEGLLATSGVFVGTLGDGDQRMGAILTPGDRMGTYRLSLSHRGQGTTHDGTEIVLDLEGTRLDREFALGGDARVSIVDLYGSEIPARAEGTVKIRYRDDWDGTYDVEINGRVEDRPLVLAGRLGSGRWMDTHRTLGSVLDGVQPRSSRMVSYSWPTPTPEP